jgi:acylphosphatase
VRAIVEWCRHGPPDAVVESVEVTFEEPVGETGFRVR